MMNIGNITEDTVIDFKFNTHKEDGTPLTLAGSPALGVYKSNGTTESTAGITLTVDFDGRTGMHHVRVDTSSDAFYAINNNYQVVITNGTVDGKTVEGYVVGEFSIENRFGLTLQQARDAMKLAPSGGAPAAGSVDTHLDDIQAKTDNLPADPASDTNVDANETKIDAVQSDVTAVKAKTDNLPADPASETNVDAVETKVDGVKAKTDQLAFSSANKIDANMKAIDEQDTDGNNATLKLKKLDIQNTGDMAVKIQSDTDHAIDIQTTTSGNGINIIAKGTGMNIQGEGAGIIAKAGTSGDGMVISAAGSNKHGLKITSGSGAYSSGIFAYAQSPNGSGIYAQADTMHGMELKGGTSGKDIDADEIDAIKVKTDLLPSDPASETNVNANETKIDAVKVDTAAIKLKTDNLPSDPTSETNATTNKNTIITEVDANETKIDALQTDVTAVKAKTDNLPADPASESNVDAVETKVDALPSASDIDTELSGNHGSGSWESGSFWTDAELKQIRDALGIDGIKVAAVNGQLQAIKTGVDGTYTTPLAESYSVKGATKTMAQFMYEIRQFFMEFAYTPAGKRVVKKLNQTATAKEFQLDDVNIPTANTEVV